MPVNRYFNQTTHQREQKLLDDLMVEAIQIHGHSVFYIPREDANIDALFGEDPLSSFDTASEIEMYIKSTQSFAGQSEFISKFGLQIEDQIVLSVSTRRFDEVMQGRLTRPREQDLIFIEMTPTNRYLFTIMFVENKEQLFQLGKLYTYELRCEIMNYSHERVRTILPDVNAVAESKAYTLSLELGAGSGTYEPGEMVYQGSTLLTADATASVHQVANGILYLQNIVGTFDTVTPIVGVSSNASYVIVSTPDTLPAVHDPVADNTLLETEKATVVVNRGNNPRY